VAYTTRRARDAATAKTLWSISEDLTSVRFVVG